MHSLAGRATPPPYPSLAVIWTGIGTGAVFPRRARGASAPAPPTRSRRVTGSEVECSAALAGAIEHARSPAAATSQAFPDGPVSAKCARARRGRASTHRPAPLALEVPNARQ